MTSVFVAVAVSVCVGYCCSCGCISVLTCVYGCRYTCCTRLFLVAVWCVSVLAAYTCGQYNVVCHTWGVPNHWTGLDYRTHRPHPFICLIQATGLKLCRCNKCGSCLVVATRFKNWKTNYTASMDFNIKLKIWEEEQMEF